ncbi:MAG: hydroxymethylbilane synthase, partial [Sedimentisphaerales bacterium]|nr:hydroxymethylbilane synthase [Sedimentisphaerales bacterium]
TCLSLDPREFLPACGQGALAIEIRQGNSKIETIVKQLNHRPTELRVKAERSFLATMGGGCQVPMGAYAWLESGKLYIRAMTGEINGHNVRYAQCCGPEQEAAELGREVAAKINKGRK